MHMKVKITQKEVAKTGGWKQLGMQLPNKSPSMRINDGAFQSLPIEFYWDSFMSKFSFITLLTNNHDSIHPLDFDVLLLALPNLDNVCITYIIHISQRFPLTKLFLYLVACYFWTKGQILVENIYHKPMFS